jgi:hypothetical protein
MLLVWKLLMRRDIKLEYLHQIPWSAKEIQLLLTNKDFNMDQYQIYKRQRDKGEAQAGEKTNNWTKSTYLHHHWPSFTTIISSWLLHNLHYEQWLISYTLIESGHMPQIVSIKSFHIKRSRRIIGRVLEMQTRQIQIKVNNQDQIQKKPNPDFCSSTRSFSSVHQWIQCNESTHKAKSIQT